MPDYEFADQYAVLEQLENGGYTNFTALVDTERHRVKEVARQIAEIPMTSTVEAILAFGAPESYTLLTTGWLKGPIVDNVDEFMGRLAEIKGILKNPDGSMKCHFYVAGRIFKWYMPNVKKR
jgi:hypothetical protein